ncbi:MAG TPA: 5-(carboxyamino)imidazole ribonucleotide mutase [Armatimonadetes bacterium]|nr:5-(carboxyamino)imidazole ribonucleotide mutase [Armatimonadota bacterium]
MSVRRTVLVGILMGSNSDLPVMEQAAELLQAQGIGWEMRCLSAHRSPEAVAAYARGAAERGLRVIIAGAGGAAHLPGVVAAHTILPVIGVPCSGKTLSGADSLYSIVQMPPGVPVATVGLDAGRNAGILALQILGVRDRSLRPKLEALKAGLLAENEQKDAAVREAAQRIQEAT